MRKKIEGLAKMFVVCSSICYSAETVQNNVSYPAAAAIDVRGSLPVQFFAEASFTYWMAQEGGLGIAESAVVTPLGRTVNSVDSKTFQQSSAYVPGFEVGIGLVAVEQWVLEAKYTWFRSKISTNKNAPENTTQSGQSIWNVDDWFLQTTAITGQSLSGTQLTSHWHLGMDLGDLTLSRPCYFTKNAIFSPFAGVRTVWIRQQMNLDLMQSPSSVGGTGNLGTQPLYSTTSSHSWGLGPRLGFDASFLLGKGFRFEGNVAASLLYTRFSAINHYEQRQSLLIPQESFQASMGDFGCARPVAEAGMGIGWGTYCFNNLYHIDFTAEYEFYYFWGQNVMRQMLDQHWSGTSSQAADLSFQGLTFRARFDF